MNFSNQLFALSAGLVLSSFPFLFCSPSVSPSRCPISLSLARSIPLTYLSSLSLCMCAHFRNAPSEIANLPDDMKAFNDREGSNVVVEKLFVDGDIDLKGQTILCGLILIIWQQELR